MQFQQVSDFPQVSDSQQVGDFQQVGDIQGKVRRDGQYYSLKKFITPTEPLIRDLAAILYQGGNFVKDAQDFVHSEVKYKSERGDFWQMPVQTLEKGVGDCEDSSLLLCSILKNYTDSYVVLGSWKNQGHAWLISGEPWHIIESTANSQKPVKEKGYLPQLFFNNEQVWVSSQSDFDFLVIKGYPQFNLI